MKIKVGLDLQSIQEAIDKLNQAKSSLQHEMINDLLIGCCEGYGGIKGLIDLANERLAVADIGQNVKDEIARSWRIEQQGTNKVVLHNEHDKAVYVEFGVGVVGQSQPHENAALAGYRYNVESRYKKSDGSWIFKLDDRNDLDISIDNVIDAEKHEHTIRTRGQVGYMYLYNALMDFKDFNLPQMWEKIKTKYWR